MTPTSRDQDREQALASIARTYESYRRSGYDARWSSLSAGMRRVVEERDAWLLSNIPAGATVVDLGCGDGHLGLTIGAAHGEAGRYIGVDVLEDRLRMARERVPWGEFVVGSADRVPISSGSADVVAAVTLLSSVLQPWFRQAIAGEVRRILRDGGRFLIYDLRYASPRNPAVAPVSVAELARLFPGWRLEQQTLGLLPPIARTRLAAPRPVFSVLSAIPVLRSHLGIALFAPPRSGGGAA